MTKPKNKGKDSAQQQQQRQQPRQQLTREQAVTGNKFRQERQKNQTNTQIGWVGLGWVLSAFDDSNGNKLDCLTANACSVARVHNIGHILV